MKRIGAAMGALTLGCALAVTGCGSTGHPTSTPASRVAPQTPDTHPPPGAARPTTAAPAGPATSFNGDGTYVVGVDIAPGTYRSSGSENSVGCYWARLRDLSGESIITNNVGTGPAVMAVAPTDAAVEVQGCAPWTMIADAPRAPAPTPRAAPPAPAAPPENPAAGSATDEYYRGLLRADGVFFPSDADALAEGRHVCDLYSGGDDNNSVTRQVMQDYPDLSKEDAMSVGHDATLAYCPQYS